MGPKNYKRLSLSERIIIETLLGEKRTKTYIAKKLNRARSTISREINAWVNNPEDRYKAALANSYAKDWNDKKRTDTKLTLSKVLKMHVYKGLLDGLSPESISGRLKLLFPGDPMLNISYESIYKHIYEHPQSSTGKELIGLLLRCKTAYRGRKGIKKNHQSVKDRVSIDARPAHIEDRLEVGHWEGDLMIGANQGSCIGTLVERKTRFTVLVKLDDKKSESVRMAFSQKLCDQPSYLRKTMTYDNGTEMAQHKILSEQTGMSIYFAHPYSSWERGTNENTNGLVRRFYPKKTDFNTVSEGDLSRLQDRLNNRPRKVLGYYTPNEMYQYEISKTKENGYDAMVLEMGNKSPSDLFSFLIPRLK
jgi:transposase, IS30 family